MKEALLRCFALGLKVEISFDFNQCLIEVICDRTINKRTQYIPLDNHLDYAIPGAIDFCIKDLFKHREEIDK